MDKTPNVVSDAWPFLLEWFAVVPFFKRFVDFVLSEFEHRLCITTSSLLLTPSSAVGEVERAASAACVVLLEVVAVLDIVPGPRFGHE